MKKFTILFGIGIISSFMILGCSNPKDEKTLDDVIIEKSEIDTLSNENSNDKNKGYELDSSKNPDLQGEDDPEQIAAMTEAENSGVSMSGSENINEVRIKDLSTVNPSNLSLKQKLNSNLIDYFKHYYPNLDKDYYAYVVEGSEEETNTYYTVKLRIEGFNADGTDFIVKAIWPFGTPTDQFNFYSDLTPDGTYVLVDKDGNPIDWDSPINNPFSEEE